MGKIVIIFLLFSQMVLSRQLITNGDILFYYDDARKIATDIKGNIFSAVDISQIDIGIIIDGEHSYLREYLEETYADKEKNLVENNGIIENIPFKIIYTFINENEFSVKIILMGDIISKDRIKITYNIVPKKDNGYLEFGKNGKYIYDGRITFEDSKNYGNLFFSLDPILRGSRYSLSKVTGREVNYSDRHIYYILPLEDREVELTIKFGAPSGIKSGLKNPTFTLDYYREIEREQLNQLKLFLSRAIIPSEISYNIPRIDYINELNLKYTGSYYKMSYISDILEKQRPSILERLIYDMTIFKIIKENPNLKSRGKDFYNYSKTYIDNIFEDVYSEGEISELFHLYKLLEIMEGYSLEDKPLLERLKGYRKRIMEVVKEEFYDLRGIKTSRYSKIPESKNIIYSELISLEDRKNLLKKQIEENYSKDYGVFFQRGSGEQKEIDMEYNLNMVIFLYSMGEIKRADILFGKLEELIKKNSYYIPRYYPLKNRNENGIYGEMLSKYFEVLMRGERW